MCAYMINGNHEQSHLGGADSAFLSESEARRGGTHTLAEPFG